MYLQNRYNGRLQFMIKDNKRLFSNTLKRTVFLCYTLTVNSKNILILLPALKKEAISLNMFKPCLFDYFVTNGILHKLYNILTGENST